MANRFASQQDYSQTFQYLVERNQQFLESAAQRVDAQREADWASRDNLMLTSWNEGKISGAELMAHINMRLRQSLTAEERNRWRAMAVEYGNAIADQRAEAAYAESDNISALIQHYAGRLSSTKKGTPEYTQIAERLKGLRETRTRDNITNGARRIIRKVEKGQASKKDLLQFYQRAAQTATGDIKQEILDNIAQLRGQIRTENMQAALTEIDTKFQGSLINGQQAANQYQKVLEKYNVAGSDPAQYAQYQQQMAQMRATPDDLEIQRFEQQVIDGTKTADQYIAFIEEWADKIGRFDASAAWELRQAADSFIQDNATPLEGGLLDRANQEANMGTSTVTVARNLKGNAIRYISQFDGSKYNGYNCGMAAGAMMAHAMGYTGLTGADLRALSGDTSGGTTVFQVASALSSGQVGIPGGELDVRSNWGFDEFTQRIKNGSTAVLGGWTGAVSDTYNSTTGAMGHSIFIAGYDPQKGFLVLDPSGKGKQQKAWWPAEVVQAFAFSGQGWQGGFNGYAVVSPPNTVDPKTLDRAGGNAVVHIDVTAPPSGRVPGASSITNPQDPPPERIARGLGETLSDRERRRLRQAGIKPGKDLDTKQEVADLLETNEGAIAALEGDVAEWVRLAESGGMDDDGYVEMLDGRVVSRELVNQWQEQLIFTLDGQIILYEANGQKAEASEAKSRRTGVLLDAAVVNTIDENRIENTVVRTAAEAAEKLYGAESPQEAAEALDELVEVVGTLSAIDEQRKARADATGAEQDAARVTEVQTGEESAEERMWGALDEVLQNASEYETSEEFVTALQEAGGIFLDDIDSPAGALAAAVIEGATKQKMLDTGEATFVAHGGTMTIVPLKESGSVDENGEPIMVPDVAELGQEVIEYMVNAGINPADLTPATMPGPDGEPILVSFIPTSEQYKNVTYLRARDGSNDNVKTILKNLPSGDLSGEIDWLTNDAPIDSDHLDMLSPQQVRDLIAAGILTEQPLVVQVATLGDKSYYQAQSIDEETGEVKTSWHEGSLPYMPYQPEDDSLMPAGFSWVGTNPDTPGIPIPTPVNDTELMEDGTLGTNVLNFGLTPEESARYVQKLQREGKLPTELYIPDPSNPSVTLVVGPDHPASPANAMPGVSTKYIEDLNKGKSAMREKLAGTMAPEEAASMDTWTEFEMRERARLAGIDYDTGEWLINPLTGQKPEGRPTDSMLADLGISLPETPKDEMGQQYIDHLAEAKRQAAVERANKAAKEAAAAKAAAEEEARSSLPTIGPKPSAGTLPTLPKPKETKQEPPLPTPSKPPKPTPVPTVPKQEPLGPPAPAPKPTLNITKPVPEPKKTVTPSPGKPEML